VPGLPFSFFGFMRVKVMPNLELYHAKSFE